MQWNSLLKQTGFRKQGTLYVNPVTGRTNARSTALNNAASIIGYKDYSKAKEAFSSKAYKRMNRFLKDAGKKNDKEFNVLFAKAWKDKDKKIKSGRAAKSHNLTRLLKYVEKLPKNFRNPYGHPL